MIVEYSSNNSGGRWWLSEKDWLALKSEGWDIGEKSKDFKVYMSAKKEFKFLQVAKAEFEAITGQDAEDSGCDCCGEPHNFYTYEAEAAQ